MLSLLLIRTRSSRRWVVFFRRRLTRAPPHEVTHCTARAIATSVELAVSTVRWIWTAHGLPPHRWQTLKLSKDSALAEKSINVVGPFVGPPDHGVVRSVDKKSLIQTLDRTYPGLPMKKCRAGTTIHDHQHFVWRADLDVIVTARSRGFQPLESPH